MEAWCLYSQKEIRLKGENDKNNLDFPARLIFCDEQYGCLSTAWWRHLGLSSYALSAWLKLTVSLGISCKGSCLLRDYPDKVSNTVKIQRELEIIIYWQQRSILWDRPLFVSCFFIFLWVLLLWVEKLSGTITRYQDSISVELKCLQHSSSTNHKN